MLINAGSNVQELAAYERAEHVVTNTAQRKFMQSSSAND